MGGGGGTTRDAVSVVPLNAGYCSASRETENNDGESLSCSDSVSRFSVSLFERVILWESAHDPKELPAPKSSSFGGGGGLGLSTVDCSFLFSFAPLNDEKRSEFAAVEIDWIEPLDFATAERNNKQQQLIPLCRIPMMVVLVGA